MDAQTQKQLDELQKEKNELNRLINAGISFEVEVEQIETLKHLIFFKRHRIVTKRHRFTIAEPTLGTLDRIASESVDFAISDAELMSGDVLNKEMKKVHQNAEKCARIIAYAVIGSEYEAPMLTKDNRIVYRPDVERHRELSQMFKRKLKPSQLFRLATMIQLVCNLGDFTNSIRLFQGDRQTMPRRIED